MVASAALPVIAEDAVGQYACTILLKDQIGGAGRRGRLFNGNGFVGLSQLLLS